MLLVLTEFLAKDGTNAQPTPAAEGVLRETPDFKRYRANKSANCTIELTYYRWRVATTQKEVHDLPVTVKRRLAARQAGTTLG